MKMLQIRNVPDDLHRRLKVRAASEGRSLSDLALEALVRTAERPSRQELLDRVGRQSPVTLPESPADAVRAERDAR